MQLFQRTGLHVGHQSDPQQLGERVRYDATHHDRPDPPQRQVFLHMRKSDQKLYEYNEFSDKSG